MSGDTRQASSRSTAVKWLALLALLLSQLSLAAHQFEHSIADLDEDCATCLVLDSNSSALACTAGAASVPSPASLHAVDIDACIPASPLHCYAARASP